MSVTDVLAAGAPMPTSNGQHVSGTTFAIVISIIAVIGAVVLYGYISRKGR